MKVLAHANGSPDVSPKGSLVSKELGKATSNEVASLVTSLGKDANS